MSIIIGDPPCVERVSLICKVTVSRKSDLPHCLSRRKVLENQYANVPFAIVRFLFPHSTVFYYSIFDTHRC